jgi:hypothetical protein
MIYAIHKTTTEATRATYYVDAPNVETAIMVVQGTNRPPYATESCEAERPQITAELADLLPGQAARLREQGHIIDLMNWNEQDDAIAIREGWVIANADGSYQLQKLDEAGTFKDDGEAWQHVWDRANVGSETHRRALFFLMRHNVQEFHEIVTSCMGLSSIGIARPRLVA